MEWLLTTSYGFSASLARNVLPEPIDIQHASQHATLVVRSVEAANASTIPVPHQIIRLACVELLGSLRRAKRGAFFNEARAKRMKRVKETSGLVSSGCSRP